MGWNGGLGSRRAAGSAGLGLFRLAAGTEQVRVVVLVHGKHLYRLIAVALQSQFARYEQVFQSVAASFTPLDPAS